MEIEQEVYFLREEVIRLKEENEGIHQDRELAGEIGKSLLENNQELERKLDEINNEYISAVGRIEELKQESHTLRTKLETEMRANSNHAHELEDWKQRLRQEFDADSKSRQITSEKKINDLRKEIESLENDMKKHTLIETQLQEKIRRQEDMLQTAHRSIEELQNKGRCRLESIEEYISLATELQEERDALTMKVTDLQDNHERLLFDNKVLKEKFESLGEELQEKSRQAQTWFNCLQEARHEAGELKAELDNLKADNARRNFGKEGNSLFGEVEDRRLELEKQHAGLQARHVGVVKMYNMTKQHLHRLKNQVATLLQVKSCHADVSQIQRLTQALVQKESEVKILNAKVSSLEKQKEERNVSGRLMEFHDAFSEFGDKKDYVNFLQLQLEDSKKRATAMNKELQTKTLLQLSESDRLRHTEHQLHAAESKVERLNSDNIKLRLKIDELRIKLQSNSQKELSDEPQNANSGLRKSKSASVIGSRGTNQKPSNVKNNETTENDRNSKCNVDVANKATKPVLTPLNVTPENGPGLVNNDTKEGKKMISPPTLGSIPGISTKIKTPCLVSSSCDEKNEVKTAADKPYPTRKPKVSFQSDIVGSSSDAEKDFKGQSEKRSEEKGKPQKENFEPEENVANRESTPTVTVKGQKTAPVVINVKKGEVKNQCPQQ